MEERTHSKANLNAVAKRHKRRPRAIDWSIAQRAKKLQIAVLLSLFVVSVFVVRLLSNKIIRKYQKPKMQFWNFPIRRRVLLRILSSAGEGSIIDLIMRFPGETIVSNYPFCLFANFRSLSQPLSWHRSILEENKLKRQQ